MPRYVFKLPDLGEGTAEAEIAAWHVAPGDVVAEDQKLVDLMTDKATVEIPSPVAGRVVALHGDTGQRRAVGSDLIVFEVAENGNAPDETGPEISAPTDRRPAVPVAAAEAALPAASERTVVMSDRVADRDPQGEKRRDASDAGVPQGSPSSIPLEKPIASPAVRRHAWERGIALQFVPGSGPAGRIIQADLDAYVPANGRAAPSGAAAGFREDRVDEVKIAGLRRVIAERLQEAKRRIPHFSYIEEVDVTALEELRRHLNGGKGEARPRLTLLPFLMRAMVKALVDHSQLNARFDDAAGILRRHSAVHIGIATQISGGLVVPVCRHAEALDLWGAAAEVARLAGAARDGTATRDELSGSTITITSLGALGGLATTPVINDPEVAIVGVNKIAERPVVRDGQIVIRKIMNLSSSFDHRIVDGWEAAAFIQRVRGLLEQPAALFLNDR